MVKNTAMAKKLMMGAKNISPHHWETPASRARRNVIATPIHSSGSAQTAISTVVQTMASSEPKDDRIRLPRSAKVGAI